MLKNFGLSPTSAKAVKVGDVFGRLTVVATGQVPGTYRYKAVCRCSCGGKLKAIRFDHLLKGVTISCGCVQKERSTKHGLHQSPHYDRWKNMMDRCYNPECESYPNYGGRGIKVCKRWHDIQKFIADLPDGYFEGAEIDRVDNNGDYSPGNIRWATHSVNCDNRRSGRKVTFRGKTQSVRRWSQETGINEGTLWERLSVWGWSPNKALTTPPLSPDERMEKARQARWAGHTKKPKPKPLVLRRVDVNGEQLTIAELSDRTGIDSRLLRKRIFERGWPIEKAIQDRLK